MRRTAIGVAVAGLVGSTGAASASAAPTLKLVTRTPLVVSGTHFKASEQVTLHVGTASFVVRTTPLGTFRAALGSPLADRCSASIVAVSVHAERVVLPLLMRAMCAPASPASPAASSGASP